MYMKDCTNGCLYAGCLEVETEVLIEKEQLESPDITLNTGILTIFCC